MGPSLRDHSFYARPPTRERPSTRDQGENSLVVPSRTSSLHSRITQPIPSQANLKPAQRTPKTLTHAYMVCGVGREPSQWVKAPTPSQGKIGHMKGAVGQFWLPEILGSSPRLEQDNEIAKALHSAMRVSSLRNKMGWGNEKLTIDRPAFLTMSRFAPAKTNHTAFTMLSFYSRILLIPFTELPCASGPALMKSAPRQSVNCAKRRSLTSTTTPKRLTGSHTV